MNVRPHDAGVGWPQKAVVAVAGALGEQRVRAARATHDGNRLLVIERFVVGRAVVAEPPGISGEDRFPVQSVLLEIGKNINPPSGAMAIVDAGDAGRGGREFLVGPFEVENGQADLLDIIDALRARRRFANLLHRRHQKRDQNADDRDDDQ
jgi:hypothetical protein